MVVDPLSLAIRRAAILGKPGGKGRALRGGDKDDDKHLRAYNTRGELFPGRARQASNSLSRFDHNASYRLFRIYEDKIGARWPLMALELSGHGIPALACPLAAFFSALPDTDENYAILANFVLGIVTDIIWSVLLKPVVRRTRPFWQSQHQVATVEHIDQYSFPSGHSSRAVYEAAFIWGLSSAGVLPRRMGRVAGAWAGAVCASRVALGRHFIGDVLAGGAVGLANYHIVLGLWMSPAVVMAARGAVLNGRS